MTPHTNTYVRISQSLARSQLAVSKYVISELRHAFTTEATLAENLYVLKAA